MKMWTLMAAVALTLSACGGSEENRTPAARTAPAGEQLLLTSNALADTKTVAGEITTVFSGGKGLGTVAVLVVTPDGGWVCRITIAGDALVPVNGIRTIRLDATSGLSGGSGIIGGLKVAFVFAPANWLAAADSMAARSGWSFASNSSAISSTASASTGSSAR